MALFAVRELARGETDHEVIWPIVSCACLLLAAMWVHWQLPVPRCGFHALTGYPCPACGATRSVVALLSGKLWPAFAFNPLVFLTIATLFVFDVYALAALAGGKRMRLTWLPLVRPGLVRAAVFAIIAANWAYLIYRGDI